MHHSIYSSNIPYTRLEMPMNWKNIIFHQSHQQPDCLPKQERPGDKGVPIRPHPHQCIAKNTCSSLKKYSRNDFSKHISFVCVVIVIPSFTTCCCQGHWSHLARPFVRSFTPRGRFRSCLSLLFSSSSLYKHNPLISTSCNGLF